MVIAATALLTTLYTGQHAELAAQDRIAFYHLASSAASQQLRRDTRSINLVLQAAANTTETAAGGFSLTARVSAALHSMQADLIKLRELQEQYADYQFSSTLGRLTERFGAIMHLHTEASMDPLLESVEAFELNIEQLRRLHMIAAANELASIEAQARRVLPNMAILMAILIVTCVVGWYVTRLLRESLVNQKRAEEALAASVERMHHMQKLEALGQLVGGVAHDFNNLLTAILGQASLLEDKSSRDEPMRQGLSEISRAAEQAALLTKQLLTFSRRQPIEPKIVDLNNLIRDMEPILRRLIGEDIKLTVRCDDTQNTIELDPGQFHQVILNLAVNSRDALPDGGEILLTAEHVQIDSDDHRRGDMVNGRYAKLAVIDNGVGMDKKTLDRAFEPFFTTKQKGRGTGLGLATVHGIITAANGHIFVDSNPEKGTCFEIYLPSSTRYAEKVAADSVSELAGSETVLVVEDEEQIRTLLQGGLGSLGYRVLTASGGTEGLEICGSRAESIDAIVSDVVMPDMNGAAFMKDALDMRPDAVGIYMSGYTDDIVLQTGVGGSAIPLINKPFELDELARLIRDRLN